MAQKMRLKDGWNEALTNREFLAELGFTAIVVTGLLMFLTNYFEYIQARPGIYLDDPILERIPSRNLSNYIFFLLYGVIFFAASQLINKPRLLLEAIQIYCVIMLLRVLTLYLVPLEPSTEMKVLRDPLIDYFIYQDHMISKDLFFSGHVSTAFLAVLMVEKTWQKFLLGVAAIVIAIMILIQHVHYTIDVVAAPIFTFTSFYMVRKVHLKGWKILADMKRA